jgi:2-hydroxychromene-2-carboxylate isomerase
MSTISKDCNNLGRCVEVYFDLSSPFAYLGYERVWDVAERTGATVRERPFLLGGLFRAIGQADVPLFSMPLVKQRYMSTDLARWAAYAGLPFSFPARFPMNTVKALRMLHALPADVGPRRRALTSALFRAYWGGEGADLSSDVVLTRLAAEAGLDGSALLARASESAIKDALRAETEDAAARGVFGAPTFVVGNDLFWGQDRLVLAEGALRRLPS